MSYSLRFRKEAKKEWDALGATIRAQFKKKLAEQLENPHGSSARLHGSANRYKIKLRTMAIALLMRSRTQNWWPA